MNREDCWSICLHSGEASCPSERGMLVTQRWLVRLLKELQDGSREKARDMLEKKLGRAR